MPAIDFGAHVFHRWRRLSELSQSLLGERPFYVHEMPPNITSVLNSLPCCSFLCWSHPWNCCTEVCPKSRFYKTPLGMWLPWPVNSMSLFCTHLKGFVLIPTQAAGPSMSDVAPHHVHLCKPGRRQAMHFLFMHSALGAWFAFTGF